MGFFIGESIMAMEVDRNTAVKLIQEGLEHRVSQMVEDEIVSKMISEFELRARDIVRAETEKITICCVQSFLNHLNMSEEIKVLMKWSDEHHEK